MAMAHSAGVGGNVVIVKRSNPKAFATIEHHIKELEGKELQVGWFNTTREANGARTYEIAEIQEYGSAIKNIPPRPFMRPTIAREEGNWKRQLLVGAKAIISGNATIEDVYNDLGGKASAEIARTITLIHTPKLSPKTIAARARKRKSREITDTLRKPLVDDAIMVNSVTWRVGEG